MMDIPTGFTGFTVDVFGGSTSDTEGDVTKVLFAITYQLRVNDVNFTITNGPEDWSALMPSGEYIGLKNPTVIFSNRDSAVVQFEMDEKYPSNTLAILSYRNADAKYTITEISREPGEPDNPFVANTIIGSMGFSSNEYGGGTNDEGEVSRVVFNISFTNRKNEVEFEISEDPADWAVLMGNGSYINLINPHVLFQNRDGATIVFHMESEYPSNSPGLLVRRREQAKYTITEIDEDHPFLPIQNIVFPSYIPAGERINLHSLVVVYPMNSTLRGIEWSLASEGVTGATISNGWVTTARPGKLTLRALVPNGSGIGTDYRQDIDVLVIDNWIVIDQQPLMDMAAITGNIHEEISVVAQTPSGELGYQWYKNTTATNEGGTAISNASNDVYKLPKGLVPGDYFYFCEVRKVNFPSVRTAVVKVRVRDALVQLSIFPPSASIPPGSVQQFAVTRNPQTSDERAIVTWHSDKHEVITIDQNGVATSFNPGKAIISASIGDITNSIEATTVYTSVTDIKWDMNVMETGTSYDLPKTVLPVNASKQNIIWNIISAGTTNSTINNGKITPNGVGDVVLRATVLNGQTPTSNFTKEFSINVIKGITPVTDITLASVGTPRVGEIVPLKGTCVPANASNINIIWTIQEAGTTRAKITSGNLLTLEAPGKAIIKATVTNGKGKNSNFVKSFDVTFLPEFVSVVSIEGFPSLVEYYEGKEGVQFTSTVLPVNAANKEIVYTIAADDVSGLSPRIENNILYFNTTTLTHESIVSIKISMIVKNGLSTSVDYVNNSEIAITPPKAPEVFVPIVKATLSLPSILRAYRPIAIGRSFVTPDESTRKVMFWNIARPKEIGGCAALIFQHTEEDHANLLANGVLFEDKYDWTDKTSYIYPMSKGELEILLECVDGLGKDQDFNLSKIVNVLDPFIAVKDIKNVPTQIYNGSQFYLSPEIDTGGGVNEQTAEWDDRESTYNKIEYTIISGENLASVNENGVITPKGTGNIQIQLLVQNGVQEAYSWHSKDHEMQEGKDFLKENFKKTFNIKILQAERSDKRILRITKKGGFMGIGEGVDIFTKAEFDALRSIGAPEQTISIRGKSIAREDITGIEFYDRFKFTDLSNFGRNFTSLKKINRIPSCAINLRNFLRGCISFNQALTIPNSVNGDHCLEGFLRDCKAFNQPIIIPSNIDGVSCLESFLRGCKGFNRSITLPEEMSGDYCLYSFLMDCTSLNSTVKLPKRISGIRCMENVLRNCQSFNRNITLPDTIAGHYNMAAFMYTCNNMEASVIVPATFVAGSMHDVITFSTFYRSSKLGTNGIKLTGEGAAELAKIIGALGSPEVVPLRKFVTSEEIPDPDPIIPYVGVSLFKEVALNDVYDDFLVGDGITYNITVQNRSNKEITTIDVTDTIPTEITYLSASCEHEGFEIELTRADPPEPPVDPDPPVDPTDPPAENKEPTEPVLGVVTSVLLKLPKIAAGQSVNISVLASATVIAAGVENIATVTFDQSGQQESDEENTAKALINIVNEHAVIPE